MYLYAIPNHIIGDQPEPPAGPSVPPNGSTFNLDEQISLSGFRLLVGLPQDKDSHVLPPSNVNSPHILPKWIRNCYTPADVEASTSLYYELIAEERTTTMKYYLYDWMVYGGLIIQLMLSAALIVMGAVPSSNHISIVLLGAANGVVTGVLSLIKGQGLPARLIKYLDTLRKVRDDIDFTERQLRAKMTTITFRDAFKLRSDYEKARQDEMANQPDVWQSGSSSKDSNSKIGSTN